MNTSGWIGKLVGGLIGLLLSKGSLLGALVGVAVGHQFDRGFAGGGTRSGGFGGFSGLSNARRQQVFFHSVFLAMGHLAKADGRVSAEEIQAARAYMHAIRLSPEAVREAIELFSSGKDSAFPIDRQITELAQACQGRPALVRNFLEVLMGFVLSKGNIRSVERELLWRMASGLGVGRVEMAQFEAVLRAQHNFRQGARQQRPEFSSAEELEQAYKALGVASSASDKEVKTAYRRLMNQHHPDKLVAKGLPESMKEAAEERTREIRSAYETIRDQRGFK
jgi:DnaJ like chaperone protein